MFHCTHCGGVVYPRNTSTSIRAGQVISWLTKQSKLHKQYLVFSNSLGVCIKCMRFVGIETSQVRYNKNSRFVSVPLESTWGSFTSSIIIESPYAHAQPVRYSPNIRWEYNNE